MIMVLIAALRAIPSIFHPVALRLLLRTLLLTLVIFAGMTGAAWSGFHMVRLSLGWGAGAGGFAEAAATMLVVAAAAWLLFRAVAMAVMSLFADDIIAAVEGRDYPGVVAHPVGWGRSIRLALASVARAIGWNLVALPAYVLLMATGVGTVGLFLMVNAYLLGRDMADMVQPRHPALPPVGGFSRWLMGLVSALVFMVPGVNLLAPIFSAAMALHMLLGRTNRS